MNKSPDSDTFLGGYRVLDLTNERGYLCGKTLGDFGADVIKVEPPGGEPGRNIGPFYHDVPDPEKSLYWFALNTSKRGITLNIETAKGREIFRKLVAAADFVIESFDPGYMDGLDLGYAVLEKINPRVIMVSITPFGLTGPYARYRASDMVVWAMGGFMYLSGDPDGPPCRISVPQSYFVGSLHGAMGAMIAHYYLEAAGEGQHIDVSMQEAIIPFLMGSVESWDVNRVNKKRMGGYSFVPRPSPPGPLRLRYCYPCKDGYVEFNPGGGLNLALASSSAVLFEWMDEEGMAGDFKGYNWRKFDSSRFTEKECDRLNDTLTRFFLTKTKSELYEAALQKRILVAPLNSVKDIVEDSQLGAREYFTDVEHPELGETVTYPGAPVKMSGSPWRVSRRAPLIGEHNEEIYVKELGISPEQLAELKLVNAV